MRGRGAAVEDGIAGKQYAAPSFFSEQSARQRGREQE
jgi:hypothetical protein